MVALGELFKELWGTMFAIARGYVGESEAADIVQDAFIKVPKWKPGGCFAAWLPTCVRHACLDGRRRARHFVSLETEQESADAGDCPVSADPGPDETLICDDQIKTLRAEVQALPKDEREILRRYFYEEQSDAEIGRVFGLTGQAIGVRRRKALETLRKILDAKEKIHAK